MSEEKKNVDPRSISTKNKPGIYLTAIALFMLFASGCRQSASNASETEPVTLISTATRVVTSEENNRITPTKTTSPSQTVSPSPTPTSTTPTPTPFPGITEINCPAQLAEVSQNDNFHGTLVLKVYGNTPYMLMNLDAGTSLEFPGGGNKLVFSEAISPDGRWLAFSQITYDNSVNDISGTPWVHVSDEIVVISATGEILAEIPMQERWSRFSGQWVNSDKLIIERTSPFLVRFDPFTHLWDEFSIDVPNRSSDDYSQPLAVNPVYELLVYLHKDLDRLIIWNWRNQSIVNEISIGNYWHVNEYSGLSPIWAPDGEQFAIVGYQDDHEDAGYPSGQVYLVSKDGGVEQLTAFPDWIAGQYELGRYSWSPDGSRLAIWVNFHPEERSIEEIVVIDIATKGATRYCVTNNVEITAPIEERRLFRGDVRIAPIWSPNSRALLLQSAGGLNDTQITLIDLVQQVAIRLDFDANPVNWMNNGE